MLLLLLLSPGKVPGSHLEVLHHPECAGAAQAGLSHHDAGGGGAQGVALAAQRGGPEEGNGSLEGHLLEGRRIVLDADLEWDRK